MNTTLDDGGPVASVMTLGDKGEVVPVGGLSIRDWFAGMALQGYLAGRNNTRGENPMNFEAKQAARDCYRYADEMLAARKEKP